MEDQLEELKAEQQKQSENLSEGRIGNKVKAKKEEIDYLIVLLNSVGKGKKKDKDELKAKLQNRKEQLEDLEAKMRRERSPVEGGPEAPLYEEQRRLQSV